MMNSNRERKRILVVEDEEDAREIAEFSLEEYTLICARDFGEGLRLARRPAPIRVICRRLLAQARKSTFFTHWAPGCLAERA
jgi:hypothetical protein